MEKLWKNRVVTANFNLFTREHVVSQGLYAVMLFLLFFLFFLLGHRSYVTIVRSHRSRMYLKCIFKYIKRFLSHEI